MPNGKNKMTQKTSEPHGVSFQAIDVLQQTFPVKFRGYDTLDVDSFLEIVAREMERLSGHNMQLIDDLKIARQELSLLRKKEENINAALVTVQKLTGEVQQKAQVESNRLLEEARDKAREIVTNAQTHMQTQNDETSLLRERAQSEARRIIEEARQEADLIINEAHAKASKRREEADNVKTQAQDEIHTLLEDSHRQADAILDQARTKKTEIQDEAGSIRGQAEQEARLIVDKAREESDRMLGDLQHTQTKLHDELTVLRQQKIQFETSFHALLETHQKLIEGNDNDQAD
jgi:DivIVA domain-containing protein